MLHRYTVREFKVWICFQYKKKKRGLEILRKKKTHSTNKQHSITKKTVPTKNGQDLSKALKTHWKHKRFFLTLVISFRNYSLKLKQSRIQTGFSPSSSSSQRYLYCPSFLSLCTNWSDMGARGRRQKLTRHPTSTRDLRLKHRVQETREFGENESNKITAVLSRIINIALRFFPDWW